MKKITTILGLLFLSMTILSSCDGEKSKKKKDNKYEKEIKDPCDLTDYSIEILEGLWDLSEKYDDIDDLEDDKKDKKKVIAYFDDLENVWKYGFKKFDITELMETVFDRKCENSRELRRLIDEEFYSKRLESFNEFIDKKIIDERKKENQQVKVEKKKIATPRIREVKEDRIVDEEEDYESTWMENFMNECVGNRSSDMYAFCNCALEELMYEYTIEEMDDLSDAEAVEFVQEETDCIDLVNQEYN